MTYECLLRQCQCCEKLDCFSFLSEGCRNPKLFCTVFMTRSSILDVCLLSEYAS